RWKYRYGHGQGWVQVAQGHTARHSLQALLPRVIPATRSGFGSQASAPDRSMTALTHGAGASQSYQLRAIAGKVMGRYDTNIARIAV
ncbi:hypothetical protein CCMA1212_004612, partial [Trichoderma ghanense]